MKKIILLCVFFITVFLLGNMIVRADGEHEFIAQIKEIGEHSMIVEVTDRLDSDRAVGQVIALLINEETVYRNKERAIITSKPFTKGMLIEIKPATLPSGEVWASMIRIAR